MKITSIKHIAVKKEIGWDQIAKATKHEPDDIKGAILKALSHKYIRKIPKRTGKGWYYIYKESFLKPVNALKEIFGIPKKNISIEYEKRNIEKEYGADKKVFAAHVLEYLSNRPKWDNYFSKKENLDSTAKPVKMKIANSGAAKLGVDGQGELAFDKTPQRADTEVSLNRSLIRKIYNIYNKAEGKENERQDSPGTGQSEWTLPRLVDSIKRPILSETY
jgi:hypothetical protein